MTGRLGDNNINNRIPEQQQQQQSELLYTAYVIILRRTDVLRVPLLFRSIHRIIMMTDEYSLQMYHQQSEGHKQHLVHIFTNQYVSRGDSSTA